MYLVGIFLMTFSLLPLSKLPRHCLSLIKVIW